jgi:hypothetical protein
VDSISHAKVYTKLDIWQVSTVNYWSNKYCCHPELGISQATETESRAASTRKGKQK